MRLNLMLSREHDQRGSNDTKQRSSPASANDEQHQGVGVAGVQILVWDGDHLTSSGQGLRSVCSPPSSTHTTSGFSYSSKRLDSRFHCFIPSEPEIVIRRARRKWTADASAVRTSRSVHLSKMVRFRNALFGRGVLLSSARGCFSDLNGGLAIFGDSGTGGGVRGGVGRSGVARRYRRAFNDATMAGDQWFRHAPSQNLYIVFRRATC